MSIKKIVYISLLTSILFSIKLIFGFIAGVEFVTSLILLYALLLPFNWSIIIVVCFIILCGTFYGFEPWWIMYWFIWPTEIALTWLFRKWLSKNNIVFAFWGLFWGFSIIFWYSIQNYIIGGESLVIVRFLSGFIFNLIEGLCSFIFLVGLFYPIKRVFKFFILDNDALMIKKNPFTRKKKERYNAEN